ncbi:MAG: hypothetical protein IJR08_01905 [Bacilli bacterium]|nr:hypothetical protein [Bacilli bacterium]
MNKKLLLLALPALMAMSSCTYLESGTVQKGNFFKEDASAKVDVFGGEEEAVSLRKNEPFGSAAADLAEPIIGVQYRAAYEKDNKSYIAVRFIAAIKSLDVNAEWTRSVYDANGARVGAEASYETTQAYTALSGMGETVYPSSFGAEYKYFVAYTLYDIPFEEKDDYYIAASVELSDTEGSLSSVNSLEMAARIGGNATAKYPKNTSGYFLAGTLSGSANSILSSGIPFDDNVARFSASLSVNDSFYICQKTSGTFKLYNSSCLTIDNPYLVNDGQSSRMIKVVSAHNYAFDFTSGYQIDNIEGGYSVQYTDNGDNVVSVPLLFDGYDGSHQPQHYAYISPKTGSTLLFTLDGESIAPSREQNDGNNIDNDRVVKCGGENIDIYLKDLGSNNHSLWVNYPELRVLVNGNIVPPTSRTYLHGNAAIYEVPLKTGQRVSIYRGYNQLHYGDTEQVEYIASVDATYAFYVNGEYKVYVEELASVTFSVNYDTHNNGSLYAVGDFSGNYERWDEYRLTWTSGNVWTGTFLLPVGKKVQLKVFDDNGYETAHENVTRTIVSGGISITGWDVV